MENETAGDVRSDQGARNKSILHVLILSLPLALFMYLFAPAADYEFVWLDRMEIQGGGGILPPGEWLSAFQRPVHVGTGGGAGSNPFYRPLQLVVTNVIYRYVGTDPYGFHVAALVFGSLTVIAFTLLAWLLFKQPFPALLAGLIAAAHPAGIEPYVWISATSEAMSALFIIISLICAQLYISSMKRELTSLMVISWFALVVAMLTKEKGVITPVLLLAMVVGMYFEQKNIAGKIINNTFSVIRQRASTLITAQLLAVIVFFFFLRPMVVGGVGGITPIGGSNSTHWLTALASWPETLYWFVLPLQSTTSDVVDIVSSTSDWRVWLGISLLLGSVIGWYFLLRAGFSVAAFGLAWAWLAFLPTANLVPMLHAHAERYMYLSVFGLALFLAGMVAQFQVRKRWSVSSFFITAFALAFVVLLAWRTQVRVPYWASTELLFSHDVERDPEYREGMFYLAVSNFDRRKHRQADRYLDELIPLVESFPGKTSYITQSDVFELACLNALASRRPGRAIRMIQRGVQSLPALKNDADMQRCLHMARNPRGR